MEAERGGGRERRTNGAYVARGRDEGDGYVGGLMLENGGEGDERVDVALRREGEKNNVKVFFFHFHFPAPS